MLDVDVRALHRLATRVSILSIAALLTWSPRMVALAEPPADRSAMQGVSESSAGASAEYERLVQLGFSEFEAGSYVEARSRFQDAYEVFPNARVLRALGKCEYELKSYVSAIHAFEAALASETRPLTPEQRTETEATLRDVRRYVARYEIEVRPNTAEVLIDDQPAARQKDGKYWLSIGDHRVEANLAGYHSAHRVVHVKGGKDDQLELSLLPSSGQAEATPLYKKWWVWTTVGVVAAGAAVTAAVLMTRDPGTRAFHDTTTGYVANVGNPK